MNANQKTGVRREEQFRALMAVQGVTLERPRVVFAFKWTKYRPDWCDPASNTYYEVIGSRQRGSSIAATLDLMEIVHPSVEFRIVQPDGTRWMPKRHGLHENLLHLPHGEAVRRRAVEDNARLFDIADAIGVTPSYFAHLVSSKQRVSYWIADRLLAYGRRAQMPSHESPIPKKGNRKGSRRHVCGQHCLDILELYADTLGTSRIAKVLGMHQATVYHTLKLHGIDTSVGRQLSGKRYSTAIKPTGKSRLRDIKYAAAGAI